MKRITLIVSDSFASTLSELIKISDVQSMNVETIEPDKAPRHTRVLRRVAGHTCASLILERFETEQFTMEEARKFLVGKGYNDKSASPAISTLVAEQKLFRIVGTNPTKYRVAPTTPIKESNHGSR